MKATAQAPATIAFIKYWGKKDEALRLPENASYSMSLDKCIATTTVDFDARYSQDAFELAGEKIIGEEAVRVFTHLDRLRKMAKSSLFARVSSHNSFPKSAGIASSGAGFGALTVSAAAALGLSLSEKELSIAARIGSGSACRSIPGGFVEWREGESSETSYAHTLYDKQYWDLCDVLTIVEDAEKKVGSSEGHALGKRTSIFHLPRVNEVKQNLIPKIRQAFIRKDFTLLGEIMEKDTIFMHSVMMSSTPSLFYWHGGTLDVIHTVFQMRENGIEAYFTIDAGPNVHVICQKKDVEKVDKNLKELTSVRYTILNKPAKGAQIIEKHLF